MTTIIMEEIKKGKTVNHLIFRAYVPCRDPNKLFKFDYTGADVSNDLELSDKIIESLKEQLVEDYGYPPFDLKKAKKIFGNGKTYTV